MRDGFSTRRFVCTSAIVTARSCAPEPPSNPGRFISLDYLAVDDTPRRPLHVDDPGLTEHLAQAHELAGDDRASLLNVLDALLTKTRVKAVISNGEAS